MQVVTINLYMASITVSLLARCLFFILTEHILFTVNGVTLLTRG